MKNINEIAEEFSKYYSSSFTQDISKNSFMAGYTLYFSKLQELEQKIKELEENLKK